MFPNNPLSPLHHALDTAEFEMFGQAEIVTTFGQPQAEYAAIHKSAGIFDMPWRGVLEIAGKDRHEFLGNLLTNKTWNRTTRTGLASGQGVYSFFLNLKGRVVADMCLLEVGDRTWVDCDIRHAAMLTATLDKYRFSEKVSIVDRSETHQVIGLLGPGAGAILADASGGEILAALPLVTICRSMFGAEVVCYRDDTTAGGAWLLIVPRSSSARVWQGLLDAFADEGRESNKRRLRRVGWAAYNAARIECGRPVMGIDFDSAAPDVPGAKKLPPEALAEVEVASPASKGILPAETGLFDRAVDVTKGCYLGQEIVARMHARKQLARKIVSFRMDADALPMAGAPVFDDGDVQIGIVTSSTVSPVLSGASIGLALVKKPWFEVGEILRIPAEGSIQTAKVVVAPLVS